MISKEPVPAIGPKNQRRLTEKRSKSAHAAAGDQA
jgi:hypothetical protein